MISVHAQFFGDEAMLPRAELERLVELARRSEEVELQAQEEELPTLGLLWLAQHGGAFDWLADEPDLYSVNDLKVRYR
jgi:hypothetical protein